MCVCCCFLFVLLSGINVCVDRSCVVCVMCMLLHVVVCVCCVFGLCACVVV